MVIIPLSLRLFIKDINYNILKCFKDSWFAASNVIKRNDMSGYLVIFLCA